jgi:hypothetical protein
MQLSVQRGVVEAVGYTLASVAFTLKVNSSVLRPQRAQRTHLQSSPQRTHLLSSPQRRQRNRPLRLHHVVTQDVRVLR